MCLSGLTIEEADRYRVVRAIAEKLGGHLFDKLRAELVRLLVQSVDSVNGLLRGRVPLGMRDGLVLYHFGQAPEDRMRALEPPCRRRHHCLLGLVCMK